MVEAISLTNLIIAGAVAGLANGLTNPLGQFLYKQYLEPHVKRIDDKIPGYIKGENSDGGEKPKGGSYL